MDRNYEDVVQWGSKEESLSARRAWIEISERAASGSARAVALRKESVDRNDAVQIVIVVVHGRSPQGERG